MVKSRTIRMLKALALGFFLFPLSSGALTEGDFTYEVADGKATITVYYLNGAPGWTDTFGGNANLPFAVEATTNLAAGVWALVTNATLDATGSWTVSDPDSVACQSRFYRIVFS